MKKTQFIFLFALAVFTCFKLEAQNKPDATSTLPTATSQLPTVTYTGSDKVNYVRTFDYYKARTTAPTGSILTDEIDDGNIIQATQYYDGLGRPVQTVLRQGSGNGKDMVSFMIYDQFGRQVYQPMSFVKTDATSGVMQLSPSASQNSFLGNHYTGEDIFYNKTEYESSPLNRTLKQMAPGNSWAGNNTGVSMEYLTNTAADGVRIWTIGTNPATTAVYQNATLMVAVTTDENGNEVKEYTNKRGQVILKKVQKGTSAGNGHADWLNTYYIYDVYGNLSYVLPPRAIELISNDWIWSAAEMDDLVFSYTYDDRNRMITKEVPGSGRVDMVYDKLDRLVATQDANQRTSNQWTFTKYDNLNRPVLTGFVTTTSDRAQLQTTVNGWTGDMYVKREGLSTTNVLEGASITTSVRDTDIDTYRAKNTGFIDFLPGFESATNDDFSTEQVSSLSHEYTFYEGYHDATFPSLATNTFEMNTVNFYDNYDFTTNEWNTQFQGKGFYAAGGTENAVTPEAHTNTVGMATGSKVRNLGSGEWLTTVMFYDDRGRVVQTQGDNHLGGTDISTTQYDFAGRVLHTYTIHKNPQASSNSTTKIFKEFEYDHAGRLLSIKQKLNDTGSLKTLVTNSYNELGELASKALGTDPANTSNPLESLDYTYNIRGWLKSINGDELDEVAENGSPMTDHFFAMDLSYDYGFTTNQYNGNIAGVKWKSKSSDQIRAYGFDYDKVNRLTKADYTQGSSWTQTVNDFSTGYSYDANGNILSLQREGVVAGTITTIDDLTYDYGSGFNAAGAGNQLLSVKDVEGDLGQGDFKDGDKTDDDYIYDANGNMERDFNKGVASITYNHLNLPQVVNFDEAGSITYTYDAAGIKLKKTVSENTETGVDLLEKSDFSESLDGWSGYQATAQSGLDQAGEAHVVKVTAATTTNLHRLQKNITDPGTQQIRVKAKVYLPSANTNADGIQIQVGFSSSDRSAIFTTTDQWTDVEFITSGEPNSVFTFFLMTASGSDTFLGSNNDFFYIKNIEVGAVTGTIETETTTTTTDYAGGFIYEDDVLQHFAHEEGRVRLEGATAKYDYFIKDHLGNTRMTLTEHQETTIYRATMEVGTNTSGEVVDAYEESVFLYVDQVRDNSEEDANTTNVPGINDEYSARLNGTEAGKEVGPAKMIVVNPGDQLSVSVDYYHGGSYSDSGEESKANMITAIAGLFGGVSGGSLQETAVYNQFNAPLASAEAYVGTRGDDDHPRAYLNVVVFDKDFNLMNTGSAFKQVELAANPTEARLGTLSHNITLAEGGYVYVYLSNESQTDFDVHFDNLEITHTNGTILQEDHYYPFGLSINALSSTAPLSKPNRFKLSGNEEQTEFDLNLYDFNARFYDPQLGKFTSVDPMADERDWLTPYNYVQNNPLLRVDPAGTVDWVRNDESGEYEWMNEVTSESDTPEGYTYVGKEDSDVVKDIYGSTSGSDSDMDVGLVKAEDFDNPYSAKGAAFLNASAKTKLNVNLSADVETQYNSDGSIKSKEFKGVNVSAVVTSNIGPGYQGVSYSLRTESAEVNGNKMSGLDFSKGPVFLPGAGAGGVPAKAFNGRIDASSINSGGSNAATVSFKGLYMTGKSSYMSFPGALGLAGTPNYTKLSVTIKRDE